MENDAVRTGIYISRKLLKQCDENITKTNASSRSEFISDAIEMYISWLNSKEYSKVLTPALESVVGAKIADTENRLSRLLFKLSVEMAMMMNVVAASSEIDKEFTRTEIGLHRWPQYVFCIISAVSFKTASKKNSGEKVRFSPTENSDERSKKRSKLTE